MLHGGDFGKFGIESDLFKLSLPQLGLEVVVLFLNFLEIRPLILELLITQLQVITQVVNHVHQVLLIFGLWTSASPCLLPALCASSSTSGPSWTAGRLARNFALAITFALLELLFDLLSQEDALVDSDWAIIFLLLIRIGVILASPSISLLLLARFEYITKLICEEVGHSFVLLASSIIATIAAELGRTRLSDQVKELGILVSNPSRMQVQLEIDEKLVILDLSVTKEVHVILLFLVYLHVAVMSHNSLIQTTGCQSVISDQIKHVFILELAHCGLCVAQNIGLPWLIEQELFDAKDRALCVDLVVIDALHAEANELATRNKEH